MYFKDFPNFLYDFDITTRSSNGATATAIASLNGDIVSNVAVTNGGSGYQSASITFSAPEVSPGVIATAKAVITDGVITSITIVNSGQGYLQPPTVSITPPGTVKRSTKYILMTDITRNIRFRRDVLANVTIYDEYDIVEGETPEIVAEKVYGNAEYHWIVMLTNDIYDYKSDWPLEYGVLQDYVVHKYGDQADADHHWIDSRGNWVDSDSPGATSVSNRQYEESVNESKRRIKLVSPNLISTILNDYKDLV